MKTLRTIFSIACLLVISDPIYAQAISKDYQKMCVREQVSEHQSVKGKTLIEEDFAAYCTCQAEFINKNATNRQVNELVMDPKAKPEWLKTLESKAVKSCLTVNAKMTT